ncbi:UNVERIFIED_CONTAM: hypothetical protein K2H54_029260 [Gekko kuhli]
MESTYKACLTSKTGIRDLHTADGASVKLDVPAPYDHGIPLLQQENLVGTTCHRDGGTRVKSRDARLGSTMVGGR